MGNSPRWIRWQAAVFLVLPFHTTVLAERSGTEICKGTAVIRIPKPHVLKTGTCRLYDDGTYMGDWTAKDGSELMFAFGPAMWDVVRYFSAKDEPEKYHGPGAYENAWITFTSKDINFGWIDMVTVNPDGKTGALSRHGVDVGTWNCGCSPRRERRQGRP